MYYVVKQGQYEQRGMPSERWDWCGLTEYELDAGTPQVSMTTYWSGRYVDCVGWLREDSCMLSIHV